MGFDVRAAAASIGSQPSSTMAVQAFRSAEGVAGERGVEDAGMWDVGEAGEAVLTVDDGEDDGSDTTDVGDGTLGEGGEVGTDNVESLVDATIVGQSYFLSVWRAARRHLPATQ